MARARSRSAPPGPHLGGDLLTFWLALGLGVGLGHYLLDAISHPVGPPPDWDREATQLAETAVRQRLQNPRGISIHGLGAYRFGSEEERGVCGEITMPHPSGGPAGASPFVALVSRSNAGPSAVQVTVYLGDSTLPPGTLDRLTAQLCPGRAPAGTP